MQYLGQSLVFASFVLTALTVAVAAAAAGRGSARLAAAARDGVLATAWVNAGIALVLLHSILTHDFSNRYVASYTNAGMPTVYLFTAFWAGEKGALLFWAVVLSWLMAALAWLRGPDGSRAFSGALAVLAAALLFFDILMVFASHPFEVFLASSGPSDGSGMNPLLQNPLMAVHPPFQLAGFVAYTVPFAMAMAALLAGDGRGHWVGEARRWGMFAWTTLTAGLVIGELWAYVELGWGGYWGWDPVENAALLPWLAGTALLHASRVEARLGMLRRWNMVLTALTFLLTIFATFLTRSQLISSLHSFSNSVLTPYFVYYMLAISLGFLGLLAWRWGRLSPARRMRSLWSREALVIVNGILFLVAAFVVLWGTMLPKMTESEHVRTVLNAWINAWNAVSGASADLLTRAVDVGPEWFNKTVAPVGLLILALTAVGPVVPMRSGSSGAVRRALGWSGLFAVAAASAAGVLFVLARASRVAAFTGADLADAAIEMLKDPRLSQAYAIIAIAFAAWVLGTAAIDLARSVSARRAVTRMGMGRAAATLFRDNPARYGGHLVHAGVALSFIGFAGGAGKLEKKDVALRPMERMSIGDTDLVLLGTRERFEPDGEFAEVASDILVWPHGAGPGEEMVSSLRSAVPRAREATSGTPPEVALRFDGKEQAALFFTEAWSATTLARDLRVARVEREGRAFFLEPSDPATLRLVPKAFHRLSTEVKTLARVAGDERVEVQTTRGEPMLIVRWKDQAFFDAMETGLARAGDAPYRAVAMDRQDSVRVVPEGAGEVLSPRMRFYARFEQPTSEVVIDPGLLADLYLAANGAEGTDAVNVSATINPLMWGVWIGAALMLFGGRILVALRGKRR